MKTLRNTCLLLAVSLAISFCTSRVVAQDADEEVAARPKSGFNLKLQHVEKWYYEIAFVSFMVVYIINIIIGRAQNEKLAISWTAEVRRGCASHPSVCLHLPLSVLQLLLRRSESHLIWLGLLVRLELSWVQLHCSNGLCPGTMHLLPRTLAWLAAEPLMSLVLLHCPPADGQGERRAGPQLQHDWAGGHQGGRGAAEGEHERIQAVG